MKCPNCGSENIQYVSDTSGGGLSCLRSCCGLVALGPLGMLCGIKGSHTDEFWICKDCGNRFSNGAAIRNQEREELAAERQAIKQFCSILLVLVFVINLLPLNVLASELSRGDNLEEILATIDPSNDIDEDNPVVAPPTYIQEIPVEVVEEDLSRRSEYYKEFVLNNGLRLAAIYPDAIHYEDDGQWKEIDNTLTAKVVNGQPVYTNTAGLWDVRFPQQLTSSNAISITKDGYTVSFGMAGEMRTSGDLVVASAGLQMEIDSASTLAVQTAMTSTAQIQQSDIASIKAAAKFEETVPDKLYSKLLYPAVYNGTNIVYDLSSNQLKESIIIPRYDATLWGYRYELDTGGLIPVLTDNQSIELRDPVTSNIVMTMPAPFMLDADEAYCEDVAVTLVQKGDVYLLSYHLPRQWLEEEARVWPVILDPIVNANNERTNIQDITVAENSIESNNAPTIKCGYHLTHGIFRTYLRYKTLPALSSADVIHSATIQLTKPYDSDLPAPIEVHKVKAPWEASETSWSNKPAFDSTIEDITTVQGPAQYSWDVTDIVYGWYADTANALQNNTGMMFKASNEIETGGTKNWQQFCSSDFGSDRPVLTIEYRESNGLEDYWDYTSSSAGRAGTGYVQNHSGNLVWVHSDIGFDGNRMPVSISHIYNAHDASSNSFGMGNGWRTNFNQTISAVNGSYVWEDGDGTQHDFVPTTIATQYKDVDGLELTLTTTSSGYTITDKYGNTSQFNASGYLVKQVNNQLEKSQITINYNASTNRISKITDGANRNYIFTYKSSGLLDKITYYGTKNAGTGPAIISISFGYSSSGNLTSITYEDDETSSFSYTSKNLLSTATDIDGYKISYGYNTLASGKPSRVVSITESHNSSTGMSTSIDYAHRRTTLTDNQNDIQTGKQNNTQTLFFNEWGNTISSQDREGRATFTQYTMGRVTNAKKNQVLESSQIQDTIVNIFSDSSFENGTKWTLSDTSATTCNNVTADAYLGDKSLEITCTAFNNNNKVYSPSFTVEPGESYTFSAYIKNGVDYTCLQIVDDLSTTVYSVRPDTNDWARLEVTYTNDTEERRTIRGYVQQYIAKTIYVDCVQLEKAAGASSYNLVENGDFRLGTDGWTLSNTGTGGPAASAGGHVDVLNANRLAITGDPNGCHYISQIIPVHGSEGDTFVFGGWALGNALAAKDSRKFQLELSFQYENGRTESFTVPFNPDLTGNNMWQYASAVAKATYDYVLVKILATYNYNANCVVFDGIQVTKEGFGESYEYDENGNVVKVTDILGQETKYTYENNELTEILSPTNIKTVNTYENHNLKQSDKQYEVDNPQKNKKEWKSFETVKYDYDNCGNLKSTTSTAGGVTKTTTATYTDNGNHLASTTDAAGNETTYGYNLENSTLEWVSYPEDTPATVTNYLYDPQTLRLIETTAHTDTGNDLSAQYTYDGDLLTAITTPSTTYSLAYGDFALRTGVSIGDKKLASYVYTNDPNHHLERLDFGNDDAVQYTYDKLGRVTQEIHTENDGATTVRTITYKYDNTGALATMKDSKTGITTKYYYDTVGRTVRQAEIGGDILHKVWYEYDDHGNLKETRECYDQTSYTTFYSYNELTQRLEKIQHDVASEAYTYDDFDRITEKTTKHNSTQVLTETITYHPTSDRVTSLALGTYGTYQYTYDGNGNIISVKKGDKTTTYVYDSANQLIRENNQEAGKTWVWTYDDAGNILSKKEYAYSTGTLGTVQDTISYGYGNATWGDLLTSYDGSTIFYDNIGNPTSDANWSYTWSQGRQLSSMYRASVTWNFTYDANGMRIGRSYGSNVYTYIYSGSQLSYMTYGSNAMKFTYGADGSPLAVDYNGTTYYYVVNLQGDVVAILNSTGQIVVGYTYDAWGRLLTTTGTLKDTLGLHNPLRYRGYVYDQETGLYYLQSRYYNPTIGRFINADNYVSTGQGLLGHNMFIYCNNNPIMYCDASGGFPWLIVGIIAGATITGIVLGAMSDTKLSESANVPQEGADSGNSSQDNTDELTITDRIKNALIGGTLGLAAGGAIVATGGVIGSAIVGSATTTIGLFGMTGAQTFATGALAYDAVAIIIAPFIGAEMEPIEFEP